MQTVSIFMPMMVLVAWTFIIMMYMAYKRWSAGFAGRLKRGEYKAGESADVPVDVRFPGETSPTCSKFRCCSMCYVLLPS